MFTISFRLYAFSRPEIRAKVLQRIKQPCNVLNDASFFPEKLVPSFSHASCLRLDYLSIS